MFEVMSGKYEYEDDGSESVNWKYLDTFMTFEEAFREWVVNEGYSVNRIEFTAPDGRVLDVTPRRP